MREAVCADRPLYGNPAASLVHGRDTNPISTHTFTPPLPLGDEQASAGVSLHL
jgi:hypothetical protein